MAVIYPKVKIFSKTGFLLTQWPIDMIIFFCTSNWGSDYFLNTITNNGIATEYEQCVLDGTRPKVCFKLQAEKTHA